MQLFCKAFQFSEMVDQHIQGHSELHSLMLDKAICYYVDQSSSEWASSKIRMVHHVTFLGSRFGPGVPELRLGSEAK